jgi:nitrogen fixation NifU-like protein
MGALNEATHYGCGGEPGHGPSLQLWLRVEGGVVKAAGWKSYGCPVAMACGEAVCAVSEGRTLEVLAQLTADDVRQLVGGVPEGKEHCPELAARALLAATQAQRSGPRCEETC